MKKGSPPRPLSCASGTIVREAGIDVASCRQLFGLSMSVEHHFLYGRANRLICPVNTAIPTTRPAHSFFQFRACSFDMLFSGFRPFNRDYPADPFITRERCKIL